MDREINQFRAAICSICCCNCLIVLGGYISKIAFTFYGLASIPLYDTMNPKNLLDETLKANLAEFNFIL
jgi:hypothetical protein